MLYDICDIKLLLPLQPALPHTDTTLRKRLDANFDSKKSELLRAVRSVLFLALDAALAKPDVTATFSRTEDFDSDDLKDTLAGHMHTSIAASPKLQGVLDGVVAATRILVTDHVYFKNAVFVNFDDAAAAAAGLTIAHISGVKETATRSTRKLLDQVRPHFNEQVA
jgi:hypothetical protein